MLVEAAGVELHKSFCFCNLQILQDRKNLKIDDSRGHRTVIVQWPCSRPIRVASGRVSYTAQNSPGRTRDHFHARHIPRGFHRLGVPQPAVSVMPAATAPIVGRMQAMWEFRGVVCRDIPESETGKIGCASWTISRSPKPRRLGGARLPAGFPEGEENGGRSDCRIAGGSAAPWYARPTRSGTANCFSPA